jgi:hypothetical protein
LGTPGAEEHGGIDAGLVEEGDVVGEGMVDMAVGVEDHGTSVGG